MLLFIDGFLFKGSWRGQAEIPSQHSWWSEKIHSFLPLLLDRSRADLFLDRRGSDLPPWHRSAVSPPWAMGRRLVLIVGSGTA